MCGNNNPISMQVPSTALVNCMGAETCVELYDSQCVVYNGPALAPINTNPGQRLLVILQNISAAIAAGGSGSGSSGGGNAILNQSTSVQAGASYWIDGTGHANTYQVDSVVLVGSTDGTGALMVVNPDEINSQLPEGSGSFALSATSGSLNINGPSGNGSATLNFSGLFINDTQGGSITVVPSGIFLTADSNSGGSVNVSAGLFTTTDSNGDSIYYTVNGGQATLFGTPANLNINYNNVIVNGGMSVENAPVNPTDVVRLTDLESLSGGGGSSGYLTLATPNQTVTQTPTFSQGLIIENGEENPFMWYNFPGPSETMSFIYYAMFVSAYSGTVTAGQGITYDVSTDTLHADNFSVSATLTMGFTPFSGLPASPTVGQIQAITDSTVNTWGSIIAGGGSYPVIGYYNGTNWTVTSA